MEKIKEILSEEYLGVRQVPNFGWCGLQQQLFTYGLFYGLDETSYQGRYCYHTAAEAITALKWWDGSGDPLGNWITHKGRGGQRLNPNYENYHGTKNTNQPE